MCIRDSFNAGTEGPGMIEGRISAGVFVGAGSDLGGGCSTMGTLSGGNKALIAVGRECLIGANAGTGISLGDRCTIEAGLYVDAGAPRDGDDEVGGAVEGRRGGLLRGEAVAHQPIRSISRISLRARSAPHCQ